MSASAPDPASAPRDRFLAAYEEAAPALRAWAVLRCRGPLGRALSPEDLEQEVCLEALRAIDRYDPERGPFRPWLFGVASRVASNAMRRLARGRLTPGAPLSQGRAQQLPADVTTVSRRVRRDEALEALLATVEQLPDDERRMLLYRGLEGLEHAEIAELMGMSPEGAAKRWQRLRDRLREHPAASSLLADL